MLTSSTLASGSITDGVATVASNLIAARAALTAATFTLTYKSGGMRFQDVSEDLDGLADLVRQLQDLAAE